MNVQEIPLVCVAVDTPRRSISKPAVKALAASIAEFGLLHPITVVADAALTPIIASYQASPGYHLIAGLHRLKAVQSLEWVTIPAIVMDLSEADRHLAAIDENLKRNDLSDLERAEHLSSRKVWYETKYPESVSVTKRGGPGRGKKRQDTARVVSFATSVAEQSGVDESTIRRDVQIAESIPEDVREALYDTPIADSKTDLLAIARLPEEAQREIVTTTDLTDKLAVRRAITERRPTVYTCPQCHRRYTEMDGHICDQPAPERARATVHTTEVQTTVEAFARAIVSLFDRAEIDELISLIQDAS